MTPARFSASACLTLALTGVTAILLGSDEDLAFFVTAVCIFVPGYFLFRFVDETDAQ